MHRSFLVYSLTSFFYWQHPSWRHFSKFLLSSLVAPSFILSLPSFFLSVPSSLPPANSSSHQISWSPPPPLCRYWPRPQVAEPGGCRGGWGFHSQGCSVHSNHRLLWGLPLSAAAGCHPGTEEKKHVSNWNHVNKFHGPKWKFPCQCSLLSSVLEWDIFWHDCESFVPI